MESPSSRTGSLESSRCSIRPIVQRDYDWLFELLANPLDRTANRFRGGTPSPETFHRMLWDTVLAQFAVLDSKGEPRGVVAAYQYDGMNRTIYVSAAMQADYRNGGTGIEAVALLIDHLFRGWDIRKCYLETRASDYSQFSSGEGSLFKLEGRLADHEYVDGSYEDLVILAVSRTDWERPDGRLHRYLRATKIFVDPQGATTDKRRNQ